MVEQHIRHRRFPRLHVLTAPRADRAALTTVDGALAGGAPCIQVRVKGIDDRSFLAFASQVLVRCRRAGAVCIVNDRADIALACGADGVHLGATDLPVHVVRTLVGDGLLVGGTAREPDAARALVAAGADYLGVGPVHATATKDGLPPPFGPTGLAAVAAAVEAPVIAISGVTASRAPALLEAGAHGVAVTSAVTDADDPAAATRDLLRRLEAAGVAT